MCIHYPGGLQLAHCLAHTVATTCSLNAAYQYTHCFNATGNLHCHMNKMHMHTTKRQLS
jgi:hypothetical protein